MHNDPVRQEMQGFGQGLSELREEAGAPSYRWLEKQTGAIPGTSHSALQALLTGGIKKPPSLDVVRAVVQACVKHAAKSGRQLSANEPTLLSFWAVTLQKLEDKISALRLRRKLDAQAIEPQLPDREDAAGESISQAQASDPGAHDVILVGLAGDESDTGTLELPERIASRNIPDEIIEELEKQVHHLCRDYFYQPASGLLKDSAYWHNYIRRQLDNSMALRKRHALYTMLGWLKTLIGCLHNDQNNSQQAEAWRRDAYELGKQINHGELLGWAFEMKSWFAINAGDPGDTIMYARAGQTKVRSSLVLAQLILKEAKGQAIRGDRRACEKAIHHYEAVAEQLALPAYPGHHFHVDRLRMDFFIAECWRWLGEDQRVMQYTYDLLRRMDQPAGELRPIPILTETLFTLALAKARRGEIEEAAAHATRALKLGDRHTLPSLLVCIRHFNAVLQEKSVSNDLLSQYHEGLSRLSTAYG